jgi:hypothetical protein
LTGSGRGYGCQRRDERGALHVACLFADAPRARKWHIQYYGMTNEQIDAESMSDDAEWADEDDPVGQLRDFRLPAVAAFVPPFARISFLSGDLPQVYEAQDEEMGDAWRMPAWCTVDCALSDEPGGTTLRAALAFRCGNNSGDNAYLGRGGLPLNSAQLMHILRPLNW